MAFWDRWRKIEKKDFPPPLVRDVYSGRAEFTEWNFEVAVREGYDVSTTVYACVEVRSKLVASVPWVAQRLVSGEWVDQPDSPLQALIDNPHPQMDWARLMRYTVQHLDLAGEAYWSKVRVNNLPAELWILNPGYMTPKLSPDGLINRFKYEYPARHREIPAEEMVYYMAPSPRSSVRGHATLRSAGRSTDIDREAEIFQQSALQNRGVSDLAVIVDKETSPEQLEALKQRLQDLHSGPTNARRPMITNRDIKLLTQTAADMDYVNGRKFIREAICTAFGVPQPMVGILENATLANIETARKIMWMDTIIPLLSEIESQMQRQLGRDFGPEWRITYDLTGVEALRENQGEKITNAERLWRMGVPLARLNEDLDLGLNLEGVEGADVGYIPPGLVPTGFDVTQITNAD